MAMADQKQARRSAEPAAARGLDASSRMSRAATAAAPHPAAGTLGPLQKTLNASPSVRSLTQLQSSLTPTRAGADARAAAGSPNRTGLPDRLKAGIEALSGESLDDVRVHYNSSRPASLQAHAYTQGRDIHLAPGQERHLSHEAWHVVQQSQGRVRATTQLAGVGINDDSGLEAEATRMGEAAQRRSNDSAGVTPTRTSGSSHRSVAQRAIAYTNRKETLSDGRAGTVEVQGIHGKTYGEGYHPPSVKPFGWDALQAAGHGKFSQYRSGFNAVRMHLWNGRLDGPGNETWNLAPGPSKVNSQMSAGPELAAKNAVDAGNTIWLQTSVVYAEGATNTQDFRCVVPSRIAMRWGYMADGAFVNAQPPAFDVAIDQPPGSMSDTRKKEFRDLGATDTATLKTLADVATQQERVQAFAVLSHNSLKKYMLENYPAIFLDLGTIAAYEALVLLSTAEQEKLLSDLGRTSVRDYYDLLLTPLKENNHNALQFTFLDLHVAKQTELACAYPEELLSVALIRDDVEKILKKPDNFARVMRFDNVKYEILNCCDKDELDSCLTRVGKNNIKWVLLEWAKRNGQVTIEERYAFLKAKCNPSPLATVKRTLVKMYGARALDDDDPLKKKVKV